MKPTMGYNEEVYKKFFDMVGYENLLGIRLKYQI